MGITVAGAAAVIDYIFRVEKLPQPGQIKAILATDDRTGVPYCGGGAPNIACALARLGHQVSLIYPVGEEFPGSACERSWRDLGINLDGICAVTGEQSGSAYLFFQQDGDSMCFAFAGAAERAGVPPADNLADIVVIAPILNAFTKQVLEAAIRQGCDVVLTGIAFPQVAEYFDHIHTMIVNAGEADEMCRALGLTRPDQLAGRLNGRRLYVTHGISGSVAYFDDTKARIPVIKPVRFVDPTGAGDAYSAGVVSGLARRLDPEAAGLIGAATASFVVEHFGGQNHSLTWKTVRQRLLEQVPRGAARLPEEMS